MMHNKTRTKTERRRDWKKALGRKEAEVRTHKRRQHSDTERPQSETMDKKTALGRRKGQLMTHT